MASRFAVAVVLIGGALCVCGSTPAMAQPPETPPADTAAEAAALSREWSALREQVGAQEVSDPRAAIARYQQFFEARGNRAPKVAIAVISLVAQLYWRELHQPDQAIALYEWALDKYSWYRPVHRLQRELDAVRAGEKPPVAPVHPETPAAPAAIAPPVRAVVPAAAVPAPVPQVSLPPMVPAALRMPLSFPKVSLPVVASAALPTLPPKVPLPPLATAPSVDVVRMPVAVPTAVPAPLPQVSLPMLPAAVATPLPQVPLRAVPAAIATPRLQLSSPSLAAAPAVDAGRVLARMTLVERLSASLDTASPSSASLLAPEVAEREWQASGLASADLVALLSGAGAKNGLVAGPGSGVPKDEAVRLALAGLLARHDAAALQAEPNPRARCA